MDIKEYKRNLRIHSLITGAALSLFFGLCGFFSLSGEEAGQILSFSAQIADQDAPIYSSPGEENVYQTGTLPAGTLVEIFFQKDNEWFAIRPPEGSFSWINAQFIHREGKTQGTVEIADSDKEVPVRVGADSVLKSSGVQVGLKNGKKVKILGETTLTGGKTWLKIAPPSGEFRWVHRDQLVDDPLFANIPSNLSRQEDQDFFAAEEPNLPSALAIQNENADGSSISTVSFEKSLNLELAQLYRDLFTAMDSPQADEAFDLLSERASVLFSLAVNDDQRSEVQKAFEKIKDCRNLKNQKDASRIQAAQARLMAGQPAAFTPNETFYQSPQASLAPGSQVPQLIRENEKIIFSVPQNQMAPHQMAPNSAASSNASAKSEKDSPDKLRFVFSGKKENVKNSSQTNQGNRPVLQNSSAANKTAASDKKSFLAGKPSSIVPPANYAYPAPAFLKVGPAASQETPVSESKSNPSESQKSKSAALPLFLAENGEKNKIESNGIRQVAAFVSPQMEDNKTQEKSDSKENASSKELESSQEKADPWDSAPAAIAAASAPKGYDIAGTLGYFPNRSDGAPAYALVQSEGNRLIILCYVSPEPGKSLDPFVGKKIGISGEKGWFKLGAENRKVIRAQAIHLL